MCATAAPLGICLHANKFHPSPMTSPRRLRCLSCHSALLSIDGAILECCVGINFGNCRRRQLGKCSPVFTPRPNLFRRLLFELVIEIVCVTSTILIIYNVISVGLTIIRSNAITAERNCFSQRQHD
jgi:hypothetical protein